MVRNWTTNRALHVSHDVSASQGRVEGKYITLRYEVQDIAVRNAGREDKSHVHSIG
jgi:hypothetical protein